MQVLTPKKIRIAWLLVGLCVACGAVFLHSLAERSAGITGVVSLARPVTAPDPSKDPVYVCPMDPDVRSNAPGTCSRCGMTLAAGIPEPVEFHLDFTATPQPLAPQKPAVLDFAVRDPWKDLPVKKFVVVHEKFFHAFVVGADLQFFEHGHPEFDGDRFELLVNLPRAGMYRILTDFYPEGATPQLLTRTVFVSGGVSSAMLPAVLARDYSTKSDKNLAVSLETIPAQPIVGQRTQMRFTLDSADGLEKYLGAWAHMLAASDDVIDMMHQHPFIADGGPRMEFSVIFPRARAYRVWVQFQRQGVVNTVHFDVPIAPAPPLTAEMVAPGAN